jgi:hypothetical protein
MIAAMLAYPDQIVTFGRLSTETSSRYRDPIPLQGLFMQGPGRSLSRQTYIAL